jgi:TRAP-type C4-dicarboxylate transport system permease small subunit
VLAGLEKGVLVMVLSTMIVLAVGQVLLRNFFGFGFPWSDPMTRLLVLWVGLMGAMVASRTKQHINMDVISRWLPDSMRRLTHVITGLFTATVCGLVAVNAGRFVYLDYTDGLLAFGAVPAWIAELIVPFGFAVMSLRFLLSCFTPPDTLASD